MNEQKKADIFTEHSRLVTEHSHCKARLEATEAALTEVQRANSELRECLEAAERQYAALESFVGVPQAKLIAEIKRMRPVCDAALDYRIINSASSRLLRFDNDEDVVRLIIEADDSAFAGFMRIVAEYRKQQEEAND